MIVPMKKVSLIVMGDKKTETLKRLRKLGLMHVEITEGSGERLVQLKEQIALLESAIFGIGKVKGVEPKEIDTAEAVAVAREIAALSEQKKNYGAERAALAAELDRLKQWGHMDPDEIAALAEKGVELQLYEMPKKEYEGLGEAVKTMRLETTKASVKFLLFPMGAEGEEEAIESLKTYRLDLPQSSTKEMEQRMAKLTEDMEAVDGKISA